MAGKKRSEKWVKGQVKHLLSLHGAWWYMAPGGPYGKAGTPDFLVCLCGHFFAIETKAGNNKPTALQNHQMGEIRASGGSTMVVTENNLESLNDVLTEISDRAGEAGGCRTGRLYFT